MRTNFNGPDGWENGWVAGGFDAPLHFRRQRGGVMIYAGSMKNEIVPSNQGS